MAAFTLPHKIFSKFFQKFFILLPISGQHSTTFVTLLRGHPYNTKRMVLAMAMKEQMAENIILALLSFTADQLKAFLEDDAVKGHLDAELIKQVCEAPRSAQ